VSYYATFCQNETNFVDISGFFDFDMTVAILVLKKKLFETSNRVRRANAQHY